MQFHFLLAIPVLALVGCNQPEPSVPAVESPASASATDRPVPLTLNSADEATIAISDKGIGAAMFGMTLGELKQLLGRTFEFKPEVPFMVDFDAIAVTQNGETQYYILHFTDTPLADSDRFEILLTDHANARTIDGIGPGTSLQQAEAVYGKATLAYHLANEGREYVRFANLPADNLAFRLGTFGDDTLAGIYPETADEYNETHEYKDDATIQWVEVTCPALNCLQP